MRIAKPSPMNTYSRNHDSEGSLSQAEKDHVSETGAAGYASDNEVYNCELGPGDGLYAKLQRIAGRLGIEACGIERVSDKERIDR